MATYFFDSSALVKYYVIEPGSTWVRELIIERDLDTGKARHVILVAEITRVEVAAGLAVIERVGRIRKSQQRREYDRFIDQLAQRYAIIPISTVAIEEAADLTQHHPLKAYDAVQLAVALRQDRALAAVKRSLVFVSGDKTLSAAAQAEGLVTDNPFDHVSPEDVPRPASPAPPAATL